MKQILFLVILVCAVIWIAAAHRHRHRHRHPEAVIARSYAPRHERYSDRSGRNGGGARREAQQAVAEAQQALTVAQEEVRQALDEAADQIREAVEEVRENVEQDLASEADGSAKTCEAVMQDALGVPVPIVPGTLVTHAEPRPPISTDASRSARTAEATVLAIRGTRVRVFAVRGLLSATEQRAERAAHNQLKSKVLEWLSPEVPRSWTPPEELLNAMVLETQVRPVVTNDYTVYEGTLKVDGSPERRATLVEAYNREVVRHRLLGLGGALSFVLICLGAICSYIRLDEATKGYYTNRLRILAIAGVGTAAVIIYRMAISV
jgi:hypothetical protein